MMEEEEMGDRGGDGLQRRRWMMEQEEMDDAVIMCLQGNNLSVED